MANLVLHEDQEDKDGKQRPLTGIDVVRIEQAVREILLAIGENPDREGLRRTPLRVALSYAELFAGLQEDPRQHLRVTFDERHSEMVILRDIPFASVCEHHLLPFTGKAHVGYIPQGRVVGLSKLARLVEGPATSPGTADQRDRGRDHGRASAGWLRRGH